MSTVGNPILMDSSIPQDPDILADAQEWKKGLAQFSSQYVGQTLVYLNGTFEECRFRECNLGNLICDAMYKLLDMEKTYTVVMPSYIVNGVDGFTMVRDEKLQRNTGGQQRQFSYCDCVR
ncbi:hypothetical protein LDENG_00142800 [Lucifuga dentata]|nr:hypothetical protein LDENG_00142800 [Lucifuga dentata]